MLGTAGCHLHKQLYLSFSRGWILSLISNCLFDIYALRQDNHLKLNLGKSRVFPAEQSIHQNIDVKMYSYHGYLEVKINFCDHVASVSQFCHLFVCCLIRHQKNQAIHNSALHPAAGTSHGDLRVCWCVDWSCHFTPLLTELHWLLVAACIKLPYANVQGTCWIYSLFLE